MPLGAMFGETELVDNGNVRRNRSIFVAQVKSIRSLGARLGNLKSGSLRKRAAI